MIVPAWITADQAVALNPPAEILKLGELPRAPEKILSATRALCVTLAKRYRPERDANGDVIKTWCNVNTADAMAILRAPLPHKFDLQDGLGERELRANDIVDGLRALKFPHWSKLGTIASAQAVVDWVAQGKPAVATWKNPEPRRDSAGRVLTVKGTIQYHSGHINPVVPTPAGKTGVHVTGAGAHCVSECPIAFSFGSHTNEAEFWGFVDP